MAKSKAQPEPRDALALLTADHKRVHELFVEFSDIRQRGSTPEKAALVSRICSELTLHTTLEEEIFYPAVRGAIDDADLMDEALVEHAGAKDLVAQLESMDPEDDLYDAKVTVLGEQIDHHVEAEEGDMFIQAKKAKLDTAGLGATLLQRKLALMAQMDEDVAPAAKKANSRR